MIRSLVRLILGLKVHIEGGGACSAAGEGGESASRL